MAIAFLVHGVGLPPDEVEREKRASLIFGVDLERKLRDAGAGDGVEIVPIEWHGDVPHPVSGSGLINLRQLAGLMRGFIGAAAAFRDRIPSTQRLLSLLILGVPFVAFATLYLLTGKDKPLRPWAGVADSLPWLFAALRFHVRAMLELLAPRVVFRYAYIPALAYVALVAVAALAHFAYATARCGARNALRSVLLTAVIRPLIYIGAAPLSLPVLIGIGTYAVFTFMNIVTADRQLGIAVHPHFGIVPNEALSINDELALGLGGGMGLILLFVVVMQFFVRKSAWALKVVADILCYLGDPAVAKALLERVDTAVRAKHTDGENLIFVGHSLGSVMLFQWLLTRGQSLARAESVAFVTMGSPLRRWIAPFFSSTFPAVDDGALALKATLPRFAWLNIYRPYDPIGGALFATGRGWACDQSTNQKRSFHAGYFGDPVVIERVYRFLASGPGAVVDRIDQHPKPVEFHTRCSHEEIAFNDRVGRRVASAGALVLALLATVAMIMATKRFVEMHSFSTPERMRQEIDRDPVDVDGWVYTYTDIVVPPNLSTDTQSQPEITRPIEVPRQLVLFRPLEQARPVVFDLGRSGLATIYSGPSAEKAAVATFGGFDDALRYRVTVRYRRNDAQLFTIQAFEMKSGAFLDALDDIGEAIIILIVFLIVYFGVRAAAGVLLRVYCGATH